MNPLSSNLLRVATLALALPVIGMCSNVQINGVCINSVNCTTPTPVTYGNTTSGTTANGVTVNTDPFSVLTSFSASYDAAGTHVFFNPVATYIGSGPSTATDTLTIDLYASIFDSSPGTWDGTYTEHIPLTIASTSMGSGELFVSSSGSPTLQSVGLVGPYGGGLYDVTKSAILTGLTGDTLNYDFRFIYTFYAGTAPGAYDSSSVPEPMQTIPAALGLIGVGLVAVRRHKKTVL